MAAVNRIESIYCSGELLAAVQSASLFPDSKTFVDMPLRRSPDEVLCAFRLLSARHAGNCISLF